MDFLASHRAHLAAGASVVIADLEGVFGVVRKPLACALRKHRAFLHQHIEAQPASCLALYGVTQRQCTSDPAAHAATVRDAAMQSLDLFVAGLEASDGASVERFVGELLVTMSYGIELSAKTRESATLIDPRVMLAAETAFHLYRYFSEITERVLESFAPRSALTLRAGAGARARYDE